MSERVGKWVLLVAALGIVLGLPNPLLAQTPQQDKPGETPKKNEAAAKKEETATKEKGKPFAAEIIVTSRKTEENVQEVPIAVSVVTGSDLQDVAATCPSIKAATSRPR